MSSSSSSIAVLSPSEYPARARMSPDHQSHVAALQSALLARPTNQRLTFEKRGASHSIHPAHYKSTSYRVSVKQFSLIENFNPKDEFGDASVAVEGEVTMGELCKFLLPHGYQPQVVPEYPTFTVSGLICGGGVQSTSHIHGLFRDSLLWLEVMLANGQRVYCDPNTNPDLFFAMDCSKGSIGIVIAAGIRLFPSLPFVLESYHHFTDIDTYITHLKQLIGKQTFLDAVIFSERDFVIMTGEFIDTHQKDQMVNHQGIELYNPDDPLQLGEEFYFQRADRVAREFGNLERNGGKPFQNIIHTLSYWRRCCRGAWWVGEVIAGTPLISRTNWGRRMMDRQMAKAMQGDGFKSSGLTVEERERCLVTQDIGVDLDRLKEGVIAVQKTVAVYPLWNSVIKKNQDPKRRQYALFIKHESSGAASQGSGAPSRAPSNSSNALDTSKYVVDLGIYGEPNPKKCGKPFDNYVDIRALQRFLGHPSVWSCLYLEREEFESECFRRSVYEAARKKFHAEDAFTCLEQKISLIQPGPNAARGPIWQWRLVSALREGKYGILAGIAAFYLGLIGASAWGLFKLSSLVM